MPARTIKEFWVELDELDEKKVRQQKAQGVYGGTHLKWVYHWLENKKRADETAAQERQEGREEDSLTISRRANKLAKTANTHADDANKLAIWSLCIAGVSMVFAVVAIVVAFIR